MVVKRVADLDIIRRKFITAINGNIDDSFVGGDLCEYTFEQQAMIGYFSIQELKVIVCIPLTTNHWPPFSHVVQTQGCRMVVLSEVVD